MKMTELLLLNLYIYILNIFLSGALNFILSETLIFMTCHNGLTSGMKNDNTLPLEKDPN